MNTYVGLLNFTQQAIEKIKESPARLDRLRAVFKAAGCELKAFYLAMGQYDAVMIFEAPGDEATAAVLLTIGAAGGVRTQTLRVFTETEYRNIVAALP